VVDGVEVDRGEVPVLLLHHVGRRRLHAGTLGDDLGHRVQAPVLGLVDLGRLGHEQLQGLAVELLRVHAELRQGFAQRLRVYVAGSQRPGIDRLAVLGQVVALGVLEVVRDHDPVDGLTGVARPPADDVGAQPLLIEDVPDRLGPAPEVGDGPRAAGGRVRLREAVDAVLVGALAGGDAGPEHRREHRIERRQIAHDAVLDQVLEVRHLAGVDERADHLPVRGVPADEEGLGHGFTLDRRKEAAPRQPGAGLDLPHGLRMGRNEGGRQPAQAWRRLRGGLHCLPRPVRRHGCRSGPFRRRTALGHLWPGGDWAAAHCSPLRSGWCGSHHQRETSDQIRAETV